MSKFDVKGLMDRIKTMQYYNVVIALEEPLDFRGPVPFDIKINKNNIAQFKILAESYEHAESRAWDFINGKYNQDEGEY